MRGAGFRGRGRGLGAGRVLGGSLEGGAPRAAWGGRGVRELGLDRAAEGPHRPRLGKGERDSNAPEVEIGARVSGELDVKVREAFSRISRSHFFKF